jgi:carotenoid cleavage dioxygenase
MRARSFMQAGRHKDFSDPQRENWGFRQWWEGGIYENSYVKENSVWKIAILNYRPFWHADFETGWAQSRYPYIPKDMLTQTYPDDPLGPDELMDPLPELWPNTDVVPFHYPHPVTGKWWKP